MSIPTFKLNETELMLCKESNLTEEEYLAAVKEYAGPYDKILRFDVNDSKEFKLETLQASLKACGCVFVTGVYETGPHGPTENMKSYEKSTQFLREDVAPGLTSKAYFIYLGQKDSKAPHPKIIRELLDGKLTLEGGLVVPGNQQPAAVTILTPGEHAMVTCVMGSVTSNFNPFLKEGLTPESIGCNGLPAELMAYPLLSPEQIIHLIKAAAAHLLPTYRQANTEDVCAQVFEALKTETDCKKQKKLGRSTKPNAKWFELSNTINPWVMMLNLVLRMACGDKDLVSFLHTNRTYKNQVVEAATHGGEEGFSGKDRDLAWGSMGGSAPVCFKPDQLVGTGDAIKGFFGKGVALAMLAIEGHTPTCDALGLTEALGEANAMEYAARILEKIWRDVAANA